jgi:hypothetical protein
LDDDDEASIGGNRVVSRPTLDHEGAHVKALGTYYLLNAERDGLYFLKTQADALSKESTQQEAKALVARTAAETGQTNKGGTETYENGQLQ